MKKILLISTILFSFAFSVRASIPQQPMTPEKKSAMHRLDPVDIFPQVKERAGSAPTRNNRSVKNSAGANSAEVASGSSLQEMHTRSHKHFRSRRSSEEVLATDLAITNATPPTAPESQNATPQPTPTVLPVSTPDSSIALAEPVSKKVDPPPQTLAAMGTLHETGIGDQNKLLTLPIILVMLVIVLIALVLVFAKLIRYLRGPAV